MGAQTEPDSTLPKVSVTAATPRDAVPVTGILTEKGGETVIATPQGSNITLAGSKDILKELKEIKEPLPLFLELNRPNGAGPHYREIKDVQLKSVGEWDRSLEKVVGSNPKLEQVNEAVENLKGVSKTQLVQSAEGQDVEGLLKAYRDVRVSIDSVYSSISNPPTKAQVAILRENIVNEELDYLSRRRQEKSTHQKTNDFIDASEPIEKDFYNFNENYRPEVYAMMLQHSGASAAIVRINNQKVNPHGSGVLIGKNLVLTCKHNIDPEAAASDNTEYQVWFRFEERRFADPKVRKILPNAQVIECVAHEVYRSEKLDFSLLKIETSDKAIEEITPVEISRTRVRHLMPLFLLGYPEGNRLTVHDGSWVLFPDKISAKERGTIEANLADEFSVDIDAPSRSERKQKANAKAGVEMERRYGKVSSGSTWYFHASSNGMPAYIGVESDTFRGDSGAPALTREGGRLIGILFKGIDLNSHDVHATEQPQSPLRPGSRFHERILPITQILEELKEKFPGWAAEYEVKIVQ